tara:strand:- start:60 stop:548 length:489 start_codon:yes stop_codon:yes gene_type:complete
MRKYILITSFLASIYADPILYLSPGLQIGVNSIGNFFFSSQITVGLIPFDDNPITLGATIGKRFYYNGKKFDSYRYIDGQVSLLGMLGIGIGTMNRSATITYYDNEGTLREDIVKERYIKSKFWAGAFGLFSYDYINSPVGKHNFGLFGVIPLPFGDSDINF